MVDRRCVARRPRGRRSPSATERRATRAPRRGLAASAWRGADERAARGDRTRALGDELSEPRVAARARARRCPPDATLFVASSMPVRDVETFFPARDDPPRVLANRGANGIDGTVSAGATAWRRPATGRSCC